MNMTRAHNDYLDPDRHRAAEEPEWLPRVQRINRAILRELGPSWGHVVKALYNGTACGVSVQGFFNGDPASRDQEETGGYIREANRSGSLAGGPDKNICTVLYISSIVEGVEQCTGTHKVDLTKMRGPKAAIKAIYAACDAVEKEADEIWKSTHGCEQCAKLQGYYSGETDETCAGLDGFTPCHPECKNPECMGKGVVI